MTYDPGYRRPKTIRLHHSDEPCGFEGCLRPATHTTDPWDVESCGEHSRIARREAEMLEGDSCEMAVDYAETLHSIRATGW